MGNPIKFDRATESWQIAGAAAGQGPTSSTGYYSQLKSGGIYMPKADGTPAAYSFANTTERDTITNKLATMDWKANHGRVGFVALGNATATVSVPYANTVIYREEANGNVTTIGTYSTTVFSLGIVSGSKYYANKPFHMLVNSANHVVSSLGLAGQQFGYYSNRGGNGVYYAYALQDGVIEYFEDGAGIQGTPVQTINVSRGQVVSWSATRDIGWSFIKSTCQIVATVDENGSDRVKLVPAAHWVYTRRSGNTKDINNQAVTGNNSLRAVDYDTRCFSVEIADGSGGDACMGLGLENLSNTYVWGTYMSDYGIVSPYANNTVEVLYWNGGWRVHNTHTLNGSLLYPAGMFVDGDGGTSTVDSNGINDSGNATNMANGATFWMLRGQKPFLCIVNDAGNDELPLLGWNEQEDTTILSSEDVSSYLAARYDWLVQ